MKGLMDILCIEKLVKGNNNTISIVKQRKINALLCLFKRTCIRRTCLINIKGVSAKVTETTLQKEFYLVKLKCFWFEIQLRNSKPYLDFPNKNQQYVNNVIFSIKVSV